MSPEDIHTANEIQGARTSIAWLIAKYEGGCLHVREGDSDHSTTGMLTTKLIALGVEVPEIQNRECFECGGSGDAKVKNGGGS